VVHICNPSTWEAEGGGSQVWGQSELHRETLSQKEQNKTNNKKEAFQQTDIFNKYLSRHDVRNHFNSSFYFLKKVAINMRYVGLSRKKYCNSCAHEKLVFDYHGLL
jgi:hypothetical protein